MPPTTLGEFQSQNKKDYIIKVHVLVEGRTLQLSCLVWVIPVSWAGKWLEVVLIGSIVVDDAQNTTPAVL